MKREQAASPVPSWSVSGGWSPSVLHPAATLHRDLMLLVCCVGIGIIGSVEPQRSPPKRSDCSRSPTFPNEGLRGGGGGRGQPGPAWNVIVWLQPNESDRRRSGRAQVIELFDEASADVPAPQDEEKENKSGRRRLRLSGCSGIAGPLRHVTQRSKVVPSDEYRLQSPATRCRMGMFSLPEKLLAASDRKDVPGQNYVQKRGRRQERRPPRNDRPFQPRRSVSSPLP